MKKTSFIKIRVSAEQKEQAFAMAKARNGGELSDLIRAYLARMIKRHVAEKKGGEQ